MKYAMSTEDGQGVFSYPPILIAKTGHLFSKAIIITGVTKLITKEI